MRSVILFSFCVFSTLASSNPLRDRVAEVIPDIPVEAAVLPLYKAMHSSRMVIVTDDFPQGILRGLSYLSHGNAVANVLFTFEKAAEEDRFNVRKYTQNEPFRRVVNLIREKSQLAEQLELAFADPVSGKCVDEEYLVVKDQIIALEEDRRLSCAVGSIENVLFDEAIAWIRENMRV